MKASIPDELLTKTNQTIRQYNLVNNGDVTMVALSGGKDSMLLCLILQELGVEYLPVTIDMGYQRGWGERIADLAKAVGIAVSVIPVRKASPTLPIVSATSLVDLQRRLSILDAIDNTMAESSPTPCTHCYSVKVLAFEAAAQREGAQNVAFAHHMTDAAASFLKESLFHIDKFDKQHSSYVRSNYELLVGELAADMQQLHRSMDHNLMKRIAELAATGRVDTDEPPRQPLRVDAANGVDIIRPLFGLCEDIIAETVKDLGIETEGSGCGHGATLATETPREMVHYRILRGRGRTEFFDHVETMVRRGIAADGTGKVKSRHRRAELLGPAYKPAYDGYDKM
jgi:tRNA(Ile)-lysidine synthase TilS/MesJ